MKHKIFFMKQLRNSKMCLELLTFLHSDYSLFEQKNKSYCKQLKYLEKKIHMDVMSYSPKTSIAIIDHVSLDKNRGLVDSVKFVCSQIKINMKLNLVYFHFYKILNDLLKVDFYTW